eukprot:6210719-Pleurochrysis_carterae.AAC.3
MGVYAFNECTGLISASLSTAMTYIPAGLFWGCSNLQSVNLPSELREIDAAAFRSCSSLASIKLPKSTKHIAEHKVAHGYFTLLVLSRCGDLWYFTLLVLSRCGDLWQASRAHRASTRCPSTEEEPRFKAFRDCTSLQEIELPEGLEFIGFNTFKGCNALLDHALPRSVTRIGERDDD